MTGSSPGRPVRFLVTGDVQVDTDRDYDMLARDVERFDAMLGDHEFLVLVGDLTMKGTAEQFRRYRRVMSPIWDRTYHVFGGHDGLAEKPHRRSADLFRQFVGPALAELAGRRPALPVDPDRDALAGRRAAGRAASVAFD